MKNSELLVDNIRKDFPILLNNPNLIYLDNASTSQKPTQVINAIKNYYENYNSNIHRSIYSIAEKATILYEEVREKVASFINAQHKESIVFTSGTTESINLIAYSWGNFLNKGDEILIT